MHVGRASLFNCKGVMQNFETLYPFGLTERMNLMEALCPATAVTLGDCGTAHCIRSTDRRKMDLAKVNQNLLQDKVGNHEIQV